MRMVFLAAVVLTTGALLAREPAFPAWNASERKELEASGWAPGAILRLDDSVSEELCAPEPLELEPPLPGEIAADPSPMVEVDEKFLSAYFAERPKDFLIDPQNLLTPADRKDRLSFLNYHASDSAIDLFVYIFGGDQEIPSEVRQEELIERFFAEGRPAAVVYYYLGAPQRSVVYLSPSITGSILPAEQRRASESAVMQAFEKTKPTEQLEKFLVQMSIRLYWMERVLAGEPPVLASSEPTEDRQAAAKSPKFLWLQALAIRSEFPAAMLLAVLLLAIGCNQWWRLRARYRFPAFEVEPRLGGAHAAGIGAVISFASAAIPPASQRDQVPDYLWRA